MRSRTAQAEMGATRDKIALKSAEESSVERLTEVCVPHSTARFFDKKRTEF